METVIVTGGCGFIGSHIVKHLYDTTDWTIVILDGLTYAGDTRRLTQMGISAADPRIQIVWWDLRSPIPDTLLPEAEYFINCASESHVDRSIENPGDFIKNNVNLVIHTLDWARKYSVKKFIQVSTDEVYGPAPYGYSHQEWDTLLPSNPYSASKASQEMIAFSYWRTYGIPIAISNTMNNYGEYQHPEKFIPLATSKIINGGVVPIHARPLTNGDWEAGSRVWLHASSHADALRFILQEVDFPHYSEETDRPLRINVAGHEDLPNDEIVRKIAKVIGVKPKMKYVDYHSQRPGHDLRYSLDDSKLTSLGWVSPTTFDESFEQTIKWYMENPDWLL